MGEGGSGDGAARCAEEAREDTNRRKEAYENGIRKEASKAKGGTLKVA